ncbi:hypothetical protein ZWY2020_033573 [Hordeum vulgare]|nr:hypothetical protein ZWY2020_033573 [Hordeum vulgare]
MALEASAKIRSGETSNQNTEVDGIQVPGQKLDYTKRLSEVDIHAKEKLDVFDTSNLDVANEMTNRMRMKLGGLIPPFIGVDVEYAREDEPPRRAPVLPKGLRPLLQEEKLYTFVGFSIEGDKRMLKESGLEINPNKYIDMQHKWRVPFLGGKRFPSLADFVGSMVHPFYKHMKYMINWEEDHKLWGISPLPD